MELGSDQERDGAVKSNFVVNAPSAVTLCGSLFGDALSTSDPGGDQLAISVCIQVEISSRRQLARFGPSSETRIDESDSKEPRIRQIRWSRRREEVPLWSVGFP